jgi:hypothetical protein
VDLVRGKGKGVVILLHEVPGVGKTSTAECVAFHLGRPLFPITCSDLGIDANTVELRLESTSDSRHSGDVCFSWTRPMFSLQDDRKISSNETHLCPVRFQ